MYALQSDIIILIICLLLRLRYITNSSKASSYYVEGVHVSQESEHYYVRAIHILRSQRLGDFTSPLQRRGVQIASCIRRKANANAKNSNFDIAHTRVNNIMIPWFEGLQFSLDNERFHRGGEPEFWHLSLEKAERCAAVKASSVVQICQAIARRRTSLAL